MTKHKHPFGITSEAETSQSELWRPHLTNNVSSATIGQQSAKTLTVQADNPDPQAEAAGPSALVTLTVAERVDHAATTFMAGYTFNSGFVGRRLHEDWSNKIADAYCADKIIRLAEGHRDNLHIHGLGGRLTKIRSIARAPASATRYASRNLPTPVAVPRTTSLLQAGQICTRRWERRIRALVEQAISSSDNSRGSKRIRRV